MNASELTFGVEIETTIPAGTMMVGSYHGDTQAAGLPSGWTAQYDGSTWAGASRVACEFVSPVLRGAEGLRQVVEVVAMLNRLGAKVNASCGLHVHVGFDRRDEANIAKLKTLVANYETAIFATTGTKARERSRYCRPIQPYGRADRMMHSDRYQSLNLVSTRPTVEFRPFAGTLNAAKIVGHVWMCLGLVEQSINQKRIGKWTPKAVAETSPINRGGIGITALTRWFYNAGWTKGRSKRVFGVIEGAGIPALGSVKRTLIKMARKYDSR